MLFFCLSKDLNELRKQKKALEYLLSIDTNEKDRELHKQALEAIEKALKAN
ncbi:transcriptional regulator [Bacillus sp. AFS040349]|uniref:transcriptional regulator n=1 Tax=Bacillus sp. AFS040349 TaxID=2033502 RepID=UPI000BFD83D4|nr:transcriptional regulator [Bacillus sp. AFS040349]PGT76185.1 transcriptional regulator [Bacillus sp. AFS040349]